MRYMTKKILGLSKISSGRKISLLKNIADKMKADVGDDVVFYEENGKICIEKA
jgi:hypothetical protein